MSSRRKRSEELFQIAVDLPPEERAGYLDEHCASDSELRSDVEQLLQVDARIEELMKTPELTESIPTAQARGSPAGGDETRPLPWTDSGRLGSELGHYTVEREIGRGGMGTVYLAEDAQLGRRAAIKLLPDQFAHDPRRLSMFEREARTAAILNHPNIGTVYEFTEANGSYYLAMEYVEGRVLGELLEDGQPLPTLQFLDIAVQIAEGLTAAHDANVVHRDLKPGNVMITDEARVKILDFGLAKALREICPAADGGEEAGESPGASGVYGTAGYASPEQCAGGTVDLRSDLFSFGVVLYELATGAAPFLKESFLATHHAVCQARPTSPRNLNPKLPKAVSALIEKLLQKKPEDRYASSGEVLRLLKRYKRREESKVYGKRRRRRLAVSLLGAIAISTFIAVRVSQSYDVVAQERSFLESMEQGLDQDAVLALVQLLKQGGSQRLAEFSEQAREQLDEETARLFGEALELLPRGDLDSVLKEMRVRDQWRGMLGLDPDARTAQVEGWELKVAELRQEVDGLRRVLERLIGDRIESEGQLGEVVEGIRELEGMRWNGDETFPDAAAAAEDLTAKLTTIVGSQLFLELPASEIGRWSDLLELVDRTAALRVRGFSEMAAKLENARTRPDLERLLGEFPNAEWKSKTLDRINGEDLLDRAAVAFATLSVDGLEYLEVLAERWATALEATPQLKEEFARRIVDREGNWMASIEDLHDWRQRLGQVTEGEWPAARQALTELARAALGPRVREDQAKAIDRARLQLVTAAVDRCSEKIRAGDLDDTRSGLDELVGHMPPGVLFESQRARLDGLHALAACMRVDSELQQIERELRGILSELRVQAVSPDRLMGLRERLERLVLEKAVSDAPDEFEAALRLRGAWAALRCGEPEAALALAPDFEDALIARGAALCGLGRREEALPLFRAALEEYPVRSRYWVWICTGDPRDLVAAIDRGLDSPYAWKAAAERSAGVGPQEVLEHASMASASTLTEDDVLAHGGYRSFLDGTARRALERDVFLIEAQAHLQLDEFERAAPPLLACIGPGLNSSEVFHVLEGTYPRFFDLVAENKTEKAASLLDLLEAFWHEELAGLVLSPSDPEPSLLLLRRAELNLRLGNFEEAGEDAQAAEDSVASLLLRAEALVAEEGGLVRPVPSPVLERARGLVRDAFELGVPASDSRRAYLLLARLNSALETSSALQDLDAVLALCGEGPSSGFDYDLACWLMDCDFKDGAPECKQRARRALELLRAAPDTRFARPSVFIDIGGNREVLGEMRTCLVARIMIQRATAAWRLGLYAQCIDDCDASAAAYKSISRADGLGYALELKAVALEDQERSRKAQGDLQEGTRDK